MKKSNYIKKNIFSQRVYYFFLLLFPISFIIGNLFVNFFSLLIIVMSFIFFDDFKNFLISNKILSFLVLLNIIFFISHANLINKNNEIDNLIILNYHENLDEYLLDRFKLNIKTSLSILKLFLFFLVIQICLDNLSFNQIDKIFIFWKILLSILILDTIFQYIFGFNVIGIKPEFYPNNCESYSYEFLFSHKLQDHNNCFPFNHIWRLSSFFGDERVIGSFLAHMAPLTLISLKISDFKSKIYLFLCCFAIFISGERMAFLIFLLILSILIIYIIFVKNNNLFKITFSQVIQYLFIVMSSIILFSIILNSSKVLKNRFLEAKELTFELKKDINHLDPNNSRFNLPYISIWKRASNNFKESIIIGKGINYFRDCSYKKQNKYYVYPEILKKYGKNSCTTHPHNFYLQIISETGILGILIFMSIIIYIIFKAANGFHKNLKSKYFYCSVLMIIILFLPFKVTGNIFSTFYGTLFFFLFSISSFFIRKEFK